MLDHINYKKITAAGALGILIAGFIPTEPGNSSSTLSDFPFYRASTNPTEFHTTTYNVDGQNLTGVDAFQQFSNTERSALDLDAVKARELDLTKLDLTSDYDVKVYFINEGAGYRNQLRLNSTGTTIVNGMVFKDVSCRSPKSATGCGLGSNISASQALNLGDYVTIGNLSGGTSLDFEVIKNGYNNPNNHVWHIDKNLNVDGLQHVIAYEFEGYLVLAWEDLTGGGDRDYNDVIFAVDIGEYNLNKIPTVDNDPPTVDDANIDVQIDGNGSTSIDVLNYASDPDGDSLSIIEVNGSSIGVNQSITLDDDDDGKGALLTLNDDGSFTYDPNDAFKYNTTNTDIFTYTVDDANGNQIEASVTVTVNMPEKPLKAKKDDKNTLQGKLHTLVNKQLIIELSDLLSNDTMNGLPVAVGDVIDIKVKNFNENNNNKGKITTGHASYDQTTGQIIYTPPETFPDAEGSDSQFHFIDEFRYVITVKDDDDSEIKAGANIKIDVFDRPIPENIEIKIVEEFTKTLKLVNNASDLVGTESFTTEIIPVKPVKITSIDIPNIEEDYTNSILQLPTIAGYNSELSIPITPDVEVPSEGEVIIQGTITYTYDPNSIPSDLEGAGAADTYTSNVKIKVVPPLD